MGVFILRILDHVWRFLLLLSIPGDGRHRQAAALKEQQLKPSYSEQPTEGTCMCEVNSWPTPCTSSSSPQLVSNSEGHPDLGTSVSKIASHQKGTKAMKAYG